MTWRLAVASDRYFRDHVDQQSVCLCKYLLTLLIVHMEIACLAIVGVAQAIPMGLSLQVHAHDFGIISMVHIRHDGWNRGGLGSD